MCIHSMARQHRSKHEHWRYTINEQRFFKTGTGESNDGTLVYTPCPGRAHDESAAQLWERREVIR